VGEQRKPHQYLLQLEDWIATSSRWRTGSGKRSRQGAAVAEQREPHQYLLQLEDWIATSSKWRSGSGKRRGREQQWESRGSHTSTCWCVSGSACGEVCPCPVWGQEAVIGRAPPFCEWIE